MCSRPNLINGYQVACRTCDECIATRRFGWVARAMMEKTLWAHTTIVALTYDDRSQANRDAAHMFQYADVMAFNMRLRWAMREIRDDARMRFLVAGEQGDRGGRCHWHIIIFSDVDPRLCGEFTAKGGVRVMRPSDMLSSGKRKRRLNWSVWGNGFVTVQHADQGGMNYVLSYVLKDQFTHEKSKGTMRQARVENFATGLFRMSKRPAIGEMYLYGKIGALVAQYQILPSLNLKVPDLHGYYQPSGSFRKKLLSALDAGNRWIKWRSGSDAPQWSSLLSKLADLPQDMEYLNGPQIEEETSLERDIARKAAEVARRHARREFRETCGRSLPCENCLGSLSNEQLATLGVERYTLGGAIFYSGKGGGVLPKAEALNRSNPYCQRRGSTLSREVFPDTDRTHLKKA